MKSTQGRKNVDGKKEVRQESHLTRPPRLEGKVKNARMNPQKKAKKVSNDSPSKNTASSKKVSRENRVSRDEILD